MAGHWKWDLEAVGCLLPWEEGEEVRICLCGGFSREEKGARSAPIYFKLIYPVRLLDFFFESIFAESAKSP